MLDQVREKINYSFQNETLLEKALFHPSLRKKNRSFDFERLEFLGDRVLGLVISEQLYRIFSKEKEGDLAKRQAVLVSRETCIAISHDLGLPPFYQMLHAEENAMGTILADAVEALIGAIYLDGGIKSATQFISTLWMSKINATTLPPLDYKSALQEWSQKHQKRMPCYRVIEMKGLAHAPQFIVEVRVEGGVAQAEGASKRAAEQKAAHILLKRIPS